MQELHKLSRRGGSLIRVAAAAAAVLLAGSLGYARHLEHKRHGQGEQFAACRCSGDNRRQRGARLDHLPDTGRRPAGFPPHPSLLHRLDHDHHRTAAGKPDLHLYRGRVRPRWRSGGNRERELYDRPASSALVDEHLHAYRAHHGAPRHSAGQPGGLPGLRGLRPPLLRCAADRLVLQQRSEQRDRRTASRHGGIDRSGAEREYSLWGRRNGRSHGHGHFLSSDHARRDPSCRKPGRLQRDAADGLAEPGGLDLGPGKRLA